MTCTESPDYLPPSHSTASLSPTGKSGTYLPPLPITTRLVLAVFVGSLLLSPFTPDLVWAQGSKRNPAAQVALGVTSLLATIPYGATKLLYAGLGAVVGGFSYVLTLGNTDTAETIWEKSLLGTYVLNPEHLTGEEAIHFVGP